MVNLFDSSFMFVYGLSAEYPSDGAQDGPAHWERSFHHDVNLCYFLKDSLK